MTEVTIPVLVNLIPDKKNKHLSLGALIYRRFLRHKLAVASLTILCLLITAVIFAPLFVPDPDKINLTEKFSPPSREHPMGTDDLGRDQLSRVLYGGRISLSVGFLATGLSLIFGSAVGILAGFMGGRVDNLLMRMTDAFLSFPSLFILILLGTILLDTEIAAYAGGLLIVVVVIAILSWMTTARLVRGTVLTIRSMDYIDASRALGSSKTRIMLEHILPNSIGPIIVRGALVVAYSILTESGLSYLGFGIQPPTSTWGNMLNRAQVYVIDYPWLAIFPGLAIFITVLCVNFIGDGLRDAFDPRN